MKDGGNDFNKTERNSPEAALIAAVGVLEDLLPHQSGRNKERLENVLDTLRSLRDLARCVSRYGNEDPLFIAIWENWRHSFREKRKKHFNNLEQLAEKTNISLATLRVYETGHRVPTWDTMEVLLATPELDLDRYHMFVQIVMNRPRWPSSSG